MEDTALEKYRRRLYNKLPLIGRTIRRQALEALVDDGSSEAVAELARALVQSKDPVVRDLAREAVMQVEGRGAINAVCRVWHELRHPALDEILLDKGWVAVSPLEVRVFSALKVGALDKLTRGRADIVGLLLLACEDFDPDVAQNAREALRGLQHPKAREALCRVLIEREHPIAREIAIEAGYMPEDAARRALFFFVTEQWSRYDTLDFDQRLLRLAYEGESDAVRARVREKLRLAGRTDLLTVIVGQDYRARVGEMTSEEIEFAVRMLRESQDWDVLWTLALDLPLAWSVRALEILSQVGWRPAAEDAAALFAQLLSLTGQELALSDAEIAQDIPLALLQAKARVPGRINDVVFAPQRPLLAIGTGVCKLVLWNYQTAEREKVFRRFGHSLGRVAFAGNGTLLCAERPSDNSTPATIYAWVDEKRIRLGKHIGPVTALEAVGETQVLSAGRDGYVVLWDVAAGQEVARRHFEKWPRAVRVSPDGQQAFVLSKSPSLISLPDLQWVARGWDRMMPLCAAFLSEAGQLLVGRYNGDVARFIRQNQWLRAETRVVPADQTGPRRRRRYIYERREPVLLVQHEHQVRGLEVLRERGYVLTAGYEGVVHFFKKQQGDYEPQGRIVLPDGHLTSLHVSANEAFLALGDADAALSLWDLRVQELPSLVRQPLSQVSPTRLRMLDTFAENTTLDARVRAAVQYMALVVRYRSRFDIELDIEEMPAIMVGEFDIEIEV